MKYFLSKYIKSYNYFLSSEIQKENEREWELACKRYAEYINHNMGMFSKTFLNEYLKSGFHDFTIKEISLKYIAKSIWNVEVHLVKENRLYILKSKEVISYSSAIIELNATPLNSDYTYGEFYLDENGLWNHNFLFGDGNEVNLVSKKFVFQKKVLQK